MDEKAVAPLIYLPETLQQLLQILRKNQNLFLHAGGTFDGVRQKPAEPRRQTGIVYLGNIGDLKKITRTDRYLEIGAAVSLNQLLSLGFGNVPRALYAALQQTATYPVRNLATIGGNVCVREGRLDLFPVLSLLDVRVEVRKGSGGSRWIPVNRLFEEGNKPTLVPGEIVTRFRIPLDSWDIQIYKKVGARGRYPSNNFIFCGLAKIQKEAIQDFRFCFGGIQGEIFRDRSLEAELSGKKLPLQEKTVDWTLSTLEKRLSPVWEKMSRYQQGRAPNLLKWFIEILSEE